MNKIWPFSFYFLYFTAVVVYAPYLVLYYQDLQFSGSQIGLLTGITPLVALVSVPLWTGLADRTRRHRQVMSLNILMGVASLVLLPFLKTFIPVFLLTLNLSFFFSSVSAFADSASMNMLGGRKDLIGRVRLGGTLGFGLMAPLAGLLVEGYGLQMAFWGGAGLILLCLLVSQRLVHNGEAQRRTIQHGRVLDLLKNPLWLLFMLSAITCGFAFAASNTYLFPFIRGLGGDESLMGLALAFGTIAEVPILLFANRFVRRFQSFSVVLFSMVMTALRLLLFVFVKDPSFVLYVQLLNGFAYPLTWVAGVSFSDENAPEGYRATAQALFSSVGLGLGASIGGFTGGLVLQNIGARELYLIFSSVVFAVLFLVWLGSKRYRSQQVLAQTAIKRIK